MLTRLPNNACRRYCSVVSKANEEDPIGTAVAANQWLFIETPQPWAKNPWKDQSADLLRFFQTIEKRPKLWKQLRIIAIAPDKIYSKPEHRHVFFYRKPVGPVAEYAQQCYCIPIKSLSALVQALLLHPPKQLSALRRYQQPPVRNLFICVHTHYDLACGRFGTPLYQTLRHDYAQAGRLNVWRTSHFGGHNFAPTLIDFPIGQFWGHLERDVLDALIYRQGDTTQLRPFYRGWSGLSRWEQIAEREIWRQQGWAWLSFPKAGRIVRQDPGRLIHRSLRWILMWIPTIRAQVLLKKLEQKLAWAEVEIRWQTSDATSEGVYRAKVETSHTVMTQLRSGENETLYPVKQYRVTEISDEELGRKSKSQ